MLFGLAYPHDSVMPSLDPDMHVICVAARPQPHANAARPGILAAGVILWHEPTSKILNRACVGAQAIIFIALLLFAFKVIR